MTTRLAGKCATCCALAALSLSALNGPAAMARTSRIITVDERPRQTAVAHASVAMPIAPADGAGLHLGEPRASQLGAFGIVINAGPALSANAAALAAFHRAAAQWDAFIADPIILNIDADLAPLGANILGSSDAVTLFGPYSVVRDAVAGDASDEPDDLVATLLPTESGANFFLPLGFDLDGNLQLTKANAKALGFAGLDAAFGASDGEITFSSEFAFDYDNSDGVATGAFDFETVAAHEIGHALGFLSDVDYVDALLAGGATADDVRPTTLDLFRFERGAAGSDPATFAEFTAFTRSMVPGRVQIFDQIAPGLGDDAEALFSTGDLQGDGQQASHWKDFQGLGLMDPTLAPGMTSPITANDLRALDLIGYEILQTVPEPGGLCLLGLAAVALRSVKPRPFRARRPISRVRL